MIESLDADFVLLFVKVIYNSDIFKARVRNELVGVARNFERFMGEHVNQTQLIASRDQVNELSRKAISIAQRLIASLVPRYKNSGFREEQEWRLVAFPIPGKEASLIKFRASAIVTPYVEIDLCDDGKPIGLSEVLVGPTVDDVGEHGAKMFLQLHGYNPKILKRSEVPFRGG